MANRRAYSYEIQRKVEKLGVSINRETFISLLLARLESKEYRPPMYQFTLEEFACEICSKSTPNITTITPWDLIVNKQGGNYTSAIVNALILLEARFPFAREFIDENKYKEADESVLCELIQLLSDLPLSHGCSISSIISTNTGGQWYLCLIVL